MFARPPCVSCWIDGTYLLRCLRDMRNVCPRVRLELVVSALQSADVGKSSAPPKYGELYAGNSKNADISGTSSM